jgi:LPXTG-motif cell wall-anchored protein
VHIARVTRGSVMSHTKVVSTVVTGGAAAASLPVTGSPVVALVVAGFAMVVGGLLFVRASRFQRSAG